MVFSCFAANCMMKASLKDGISLHTIPYFGDKRPEAKRRRKVWVDFIKAKRVFEPSKSSTACSNHFKPEDFERRFQMLPGQTKPNFQKRMIWEFAFSRVFIQRLMANRPSCPRSAQGVDEW